MGGKIVKYLFTVVLRVFLWVIGILIFLSALVYLPPIQNFAKKQAANYVKKNMGMSLTVDRFRLSFPLRLHIDNATLVKTDGDTLAHVGEFSVRVALWPLLKKEAKVTGVSLSDAKVDFEDTVSNIKLAADLGEFVLGGTDIGLKNKKVDISSVLLDKAKVVMTIGESSKPADTTSSAPLLWNIIADKIALSDVDFQMSLSPQISELAVGITKGTLKECNVDLGKQNVIAELVRIEEGNYKYIADTVTVDTVAKSVPQSDSATVGNSLPWTVRVTQFELENNSAIYGILNAVPKKGFDPSYIEVNSLNLILDSVYNRSSAISADISRLDFNERSGLAVVNAEGSFSMDSAGIRLSGFMLKTPSSSIAVDAQAGEGILSMQSSAAIDADVGLNISAADAFLFYPADVKMRRMLHGRYLTFNGKFSGTLGALNIDALNAGIPRHIALKASGTINSIIKPDNLSGNVRFTTNFNRVDFLRGFLPDSLQNKLSFPDRMYVSGNLAARGNIYMPDLKLKVDTTECLDLKGKVDIKRENYEAELLVKDFPLNKFLVSDSLGLVSMNLTAKGKGFNPVKDGANASVSLGIDQFYYNQYSYKDIVLNATLENHIIKAILSSGDESLNFNMDIEGELRPDKYGASMKGRVRNVNLYDLGFSKVDFATSLFMNASVEAYPDTVYKADVVIDSLRFAQGNKIDTVRRTSFGVSVVPGAINANVRSGDLSLDFNAPMSLDSLTAGFSNTMKQLTAQIDSSDLNMLLLQQVFPTFKLDMIAGQENILNNYLKTKGASFDKFSMTASAGNASPFRASMIINGVKSGNLYLDTLNVGIGHKTEQLNYFVRMANKPGNLDRMALIYVYGSAVHNTATVNFYQQDRSDSVGFHFGLKAQLLDSAVRVNLFPENPIFGYEKWKVNPDNYLLYRYNGELYGDMQLKGSKEHFIIQSANMPYLDKGAVKLDIGGIDIASVLELLPSPPAVAGKLSTNILFGVDGKEMAVQGNVEVDSLCYDNNRVGDIRSDISFRADTTSQKFIDAGLSIDKKQVLAAKGTYISGDTDSVNVSLDVLSFPLVTINPFLPADIIQLDGALQGHLDVIGEMKTASIEGNLNFTDGKVAVPMTGTSFSISSNKILIGNNKLDFNKFALISPNKQPLTLDGELDIHDLSRISADLSLVATNFSAINSSANSGSDVYGKANLDVNIAAKGPVDALRVRGNVGLLYGTDVYYTLQDSPLGIEDKHQHIVTFVSFSDSTAMAVADSVAPMRVWGIDMLVNVNIAEGVKATVNLSDDGNNRIALIGSGQLAYTMNMQGDTRFTGRYVLSGGTVLYNPPVISQKNFAIVDNSYVEWTGDIADPSFNITAVETVRTTVTQEDNTTDNVNFDIIINIKNTLQNLAITFDLTATNDLTIQKQLASLTPEQRSTQAMALLVYNTYNGPGTKATVDSNNPLNSFIEKELNSWARNNLKNVDVSFGIQSYDDSANGGSQHTDYSYQISKNLFNDRFKITIGGSIDTDANAKDNLKENFVDDISLEYRLTKRDNMFLKLYKYNTQESILEDEVVETGVGYVVRKKMNSLWELFKSTKSPESKQERKRKRNQKEYLKRNDEIAPSINSVKSDSNLNVEGETENLK